MARTLAMVLRVIVLLVVVAAVALTYYVTAEVPPIAEPQPTSRPTQTPSPVTAASTTSITEITTDPGPARVVREGADLGDTPLRLRIPAGEVWELEISARRHVTQRVRVHAGRERIMVQLERTRPQSPRQPEVSEMTTDVLDIQPTMETSEATMMGTDISQIRDPWDEP